MNTYVDRCLQMLYNWRKTGEGADVDIRTAILVLFVYRQVLGLFLALGAVYVATKKENAQLSARRSQSKGQGSYKYSGR